MRSYTYYYLWLSHMLPFCWFLIDSSAFTPGIIASGPQSPIKQKQKHTLRITSHTSAPRLSLKSLLSSEIFLLSFDGTIADTTEWRISQGIDLALRTWPHLNDSEVVSGSKDHEDMRWLRNKMKAVSSVLTARPGAGLACDYALMARLLIEEQKLDEGRSNGNTGKYASKFHPQATNTSEEERCSASFGTNQQGSRPLTVGEILVNWNKGGCLADTVLTRYHVNFKDPIPVLQQNLLALEREKTYDVPTINDAVRDTLADCCGNVVVTVGHEMDLDMAKRVLLSVDSFLEFRVVDLVNDGDGNDLFLANNDGDECASITVIPVKTTHANMLRVLLKCAPTESTIYVFESSWHSLEQDITLFGDHVPRGNNGMAATTIGDGRKLSLNFPKWAQKSQDAIENEAMMNPWTNLVTEGAFSELLSARIVRS